MKFAGTYIYAMETPSGLRSTKVVIRQGARAFEGELISDMGGCELIKNVRTKGNSITFEAQVGPAVQEITFTRDGESTNGKTVIFQNDEPSITAELKNVYYEPQKRRALILYATMTKNTEKVAQWFKETFEYYKWDVTMYHLTMKAENWIGMQDKLFFDDYDVVCLGSPIVAAYPLTVINKLFSMGAGGELEKNVQKIIDAGKGFVMNSETMGGGPGKPGTPEGAPGAMPDMPPMGAADATPRVGAAWRRRQIIMNGAQLRDNYHPLGIVFTTYSGSFFGSEEAMTTLTVLKLFLGQQDVDVVGQFACNGKEFGPAGLEEGQIPMNNVTRQPMPEPEYYETSDGKKIQGCYFFHNHPWDRPGPREEAKAKALVADLVEDYFLTYDGARNNVGAQYISIS